MPLTSGPVIFFVALSHESAFAANAALGVLSGGLSLVAYALTYSWLARRFRWPVAIGGKSACVFDQHGIVKKFYISAFANFWNGLRGAFDRSASHAERRSGKGK